MTNQLKKITKRTQLLDGEEGVEGEEGRGGRKDGWRGEGGLILGLPEEAEPGF